MNSSEVQQRILKHFDQLSNKQKQVARFIADNEAFTAFASTDELGKAVGADAATVVRLARSLGFTGYVDLQKSIRNRLPTYLPFVERLEQHQSQPLDEQALTVQTFSTDIENLQQTMNQTAPEAVIAVSDAILKADHVYVIGPGVSAGPAIFLEHGLSTLGFRVTVEIDVGTNLTTTLANLRASDLVIGIGVWRYFREIVTALRYAADRNVPIVAFTDSNVSPLARIADASLVAATRGAGYSLSPVGLISLINLVLAEIAARDPEKTMRSIREVDRLYRQRGLIEDPDDQRPGEGDGAPPERSSR